MFFRPEEIDVASEKSVRNRSPLADGECDVTDNCLRIRFQQFVVFHTNNH